LNLPQERKGVEKSGVHHNISIIGVNRMSSENDLLDWMYKALSGVDYWRNGLE